MRSLFSLLGKATVVAATTAVLMPGPAAHSADAGPVRINAGAGVYRCHNGAAWAADSGYTGGRSWRTRSRIAGTNEPGLYQTQRVGMTGYRLTVPAPGRYRVNLLLAEGYFGARGKRVFNVEADGRLALRNVDIFAARGKNRAYVAGFEVPVSGSGVALGFRAVANLPAVAAIEALRLGPLPAAPVEPPAPTTTTTPPVTTTPPTTPEPSPSHELYVSPSGSDADSGETTAAPLRTIQAALDKAVAGTTVHLGPGVYNEQPVTVRDGTATAPITILGPESGVARAGRYQATLYGHGRVFSINHSYYRLQGFTIDGQPGLAGTAYPEAFSAAWDFKEARQGEIVDSKLVYVGAADTTHDITGVVIHDMFLNGAGGECVRMRNNANHNEVSDSVIQWCGMYGVPSTSSYKYHNGEGVYIGTSPKSTSQPMYANDGSSDNLVSGNVIHTYGSECLDVKENAHDNTFSGNDCAGNDEPLSFYGSDVELRGYDNTVVGNTLGASRGYGLKLASDATTYRQGGNVARNNLFSGNQGANIYNKQVSPQGAFCGNRTADGTTTVAGYLTLGTVEAGC